MNSEPDRTTKYDLIIAVILAVVLSLWLVEGLSRCS